MFEYHGWLVLVAAPYDTPTGDAHVRAAAESVRQLLAMPGEVPGLRDVRWVNGRAQVHFGGAANRRPGEFDELLAGVRSLASRATGTYGLIHYHDGEDVDHHDAFRVLVVRRGMVSEHPDPYLSPLVPTIEDEDTGGAQENSAQRP